MQKKPLEELESDEFQSKVLDSDEMTLVDLGKVTHETRYGTFIYPTDGINAFRI
jgi:hypothetical protein